MVQLCFPIVEREPERQLRSSLWASLVVDGPRMQQSSAQLVVCAALYNNLRQERPDDSCQSGSLSLKRANLCQFEAEAQTSRCPHCDGDLCWEDFRVL